MPDRAAQARAFNKGADARMAGRPLSSNDYPPASVSAYRLWREGWLFTSQNWARDAHWPIVPLPKIGEVISA